MPFRMPARFRSLRWRLTIYYAATILAALVIIQMMGIGGVIWFSVKSDLAPSLVANAAEQMTFHAGALLAAEKPDAAAMQAWLEALAPLREGGSGVIGLTGPLLGDARELPDTLPALYDLATIIDSEGRLVASNVPIRRYRRTGRRALCRSQPAELDSPATHRARSGRREGGAAPARQHVDRGSAGLSQRNRRASGSRVSACCRHGRRRLRLAHPAACAGSSERGDVD